MQKERILEALKAKDFESIRNMSAADVAGAVKDQPYADVLLNRFKSFMNKLGEDAKTKGFDITGIYKSEFMEKAIEQNSKYKTLASIAREENPYAVDGNGKLVNKDNLVSYNFFGNVKYPSASEKAKKKFVEKAVNANKISVIANLIDSKEFFAASWGEKRKIFAANLSQSLDKYVSGLVNNTKTYSHMVLDAKIIELGEKKAAAVTLEQLLAKKKLSMEESAQVVAARKQLGKDSLSVAQINNEIIATAVAKANVDKMVTIVGDFELPKHLPELEIMSFVDQIKNKAKGIDDAISNSELATKIRNFEDKLAKEHKALSFAYTLGRDLVATTAVAVPTGLAGMAVLGAVRVRNEYRKQRRAFMEAKANGQVQEATFKDYLKANKRVQVAVGGKVLMAGVAGFFAGYEAIKHGAEAATGLIGAAVSGKAQAVSSMNFGAMADNISKNMSNFGGVIKSVIADSTLRAKTYAASGLALGLGNASADIHDKKYGRAALTVLASGAGAVMGMFGVQMLKDHSGFNMADYQRPSGGGHLQQAGLFSFGGNGENISVKDTTIISDCAKVHIKITSEASAVLDNSNNNGVAATDAGNAQISGGKKGIWGSFFRWNEPNQGPSHLMQTADSTVVEGIKHHESFIGLKVEELKAQGNANPATDAQDIWVKTEKSAEMANVMGIYDDYKTSKTDNWFEQRNAAKRFNILESGKYQSGHAKLEVDTANQMATDNMLEGKPSTMSAQEYLYHRNMLKLYVDFEGDKDLTLTRDIKAAGLTREQFDAWLNNTMEGDVKDLESLANSKVGAHLGRLLIEKDIFCKDFVPNDFQKAVIAQSMATVDIEGKMTKYGAGFYVGPSSGIGLTNNIIGSKYMTVDCEGHIKYVFHKGGNGGIVHQGGGKPVVAPQPAPVEVKTNVEVNVECKECPEIKQPEPVKEPEPVVVPEPVKEPDPVVPEKKPMVVITRKVVDHVQIPEDKANPAKALTKEQVIAIATGKEK